MFNPTEIVIQAFVEHLRNMYGQIYGVLEPAYPDIIGFVGRLALENIADSDAVYHDMNHTIMVTLVGQGLLMPTVIRWLGLTDMGHGERRLEEAEELASRRQTIEAVVRRLDELMAERNFPVRIVEPLRAYHYERLQHLEYRTGTDKLNTQLARMSDELELLLIEAERKHLYALLRSGRLNR